MSPVRAPESSFLCSTPKSAILRGSSRHERGRWSNIRLEAQQVEESLERDRQQVISKNVNWRERGREREREREREKEGGMERKREGERGREREREREREERERERGQFTHQ